MKTIITLMDGSVEDYPHLFPSFMVDDKELDLLDKDCAVIHSLSFTDILKVEVLMFNITV